MKRRQNQLEKPLASLDFNWRNAMGLYTLDADNVHASIAAPQKDSAWTMTVTIGGRRYIGKRPSLEEAFKAADALIFQHARKVWLNTGVSVIIESWVGVLEE